MPLEMVNKLDEMAQANDMSRAQMIRHLIRNAEETPFDPPENTVTCIDENGSTQERKTGAA